MLSQIDWTDRALSCVDDQGVILKHMGMGLDHGILKVMITTFSTLFKCISLDKVTHTVCIQSYLLKCVSWILLNPYLLVAIFANTK